jgi:hypothetical protein
MADKTVAFVQKATDYAATNAAFVPSFVELPALQQDAAWVVALTPLRQQCGQPALDLDSTVVAAGSEGLHQCPHHLRQHQVPGQTQAARCPSGLREPGRH